jgi:predicted TIM-barrel fold metal-dependent hydrolase
MRNIVDTHVHLWTDDFGRYPLDPKFRPDDMLCASYRPEHLFSDAALSGVSRFVLVQMIYYGFDNSYMLDAIRSHPAEFRGIAVVDQNAESPDIAMRALMAQGVRGFRIYMESEHPQLLPGHPGYQKMFSCGAEERLAICPLIDPERLPELDEQCSRFPDTPVIIDHMARIGMSDPIKESDVRGLCALARYPGVCVKLSGFYGLGARRPPHVDLVPLIRRLYDAFGPRRLMWGSDVPFQLSNETYEDSLSVIRDGLDFLSGEDCGWMLGGTANEFFFVRDWSSDNVLR